MPRAQLAGTTITNPERDRIKMRHLLRYDGQFTVSRRIDTRSQSERCYASNYDF
jgi:hypothetical protein